MRSSISWTTTSASSAATAIFLAAQFLIAGASEAGETQNLKVLSGDRIVLDGKAYCLREIDAPEIGQVCQQENGRAFDCGHIAKTALMDLTVGAKVVCESGVTQGSCTVAACSVDGFDLSQNMVHTGWALSTSDRFQEIEERARIRKHGLWKGTFDPPWIWRQRQSGK